MHRKPRDCWSRSLSRECLCAVCRSKRVFQFLDSQRYCTCNLRLLQSLLCLPFVHLLATLHSARRFLPCISAHRLVLSIGLTVVPLFGFPHAATPFTSDGVARCSLHQLRSLPWLQIFPVQYLWCMQPIHKRTLYGRITIGHVCDCGSDSTALVCPPVCCAPHSSVHLRGRQSWCPGGCFASRRGRWRCYCCARL